MANQRQNINIELTNGSKDRLEEVRAWNGMTQKEMVSRMINWFCSQDRVIQQVILGQIPEEIAPDVALLVLKRLADGSAAASTGKSRLVGEIRETSNPKTPSTA